MTPFIDLTPEFESAERQRRHAPMWRALWLGFAGGCGWTVAFFAFVHWITR